MNIDPEYVKAMIIPAGAYMLILIGLCDVVEATIKFVKRNIKKVMKIIKKRKGN